MTQQNKTRKKTRKEKKTKSGENTALENFVPPPPRITSDGVEDVLIIVDNQEKTIQAVSKVDPKNKDKTKQVQTVDALDEQNLKRNKFLKLNKVNNPQDVITNFTSNFLRQYNNPSRFKLFKVPFTLLSASLGLLKDAVKFNWDVTAHFFNTHKIAIVEKEQNTINNENNQVMAKKNQDSKPESTQQQPAGSTQQPATNNQQQAQDSVDWNTVAKAMNVSVEEAQRMFNQNNNQQQRQQPQQAPRYKYDENLIDWINITKVTGITKEGLQKAGEYENMLYGRHSENMFEVNQKIGGVRIKSPFRIAFANDRETGKVGLEMQGVSLTHKLDDQFNGHYFTPTQKENLLKYGNAGEVINLVHNRSGDTLPSLVSMDPITKQLYAIETQYINVQEKFGKIKFTPEQQQQLKNGERISIKDAPSKVEGQTYDVDFQYNAFKRRVEHSFPERVYKLDELGGVKLKPAQIKALQSGETILMKDMKSQMDKEQLFDSYIKLHPSTGKPLYYNYNPDVAIEDRTFIVPKKIFGVELTEDDRALLSRKDGHIYVQGLEVPGNNYGATMNKYIKLHPVNGRILTADKIEDFNEKIRQYEIQDNLHGVKLTSKQKEELQNKMAVEVKGMTAADGVSKFNGWVHQNKRGELVVTSYNPDDVKRNQNETKLFSGQGKEVGKVITNNAATENKTTAKQRETEKQTGKKQTSGNKADSAPEAKKQIKANPATNKKKGQGVN